MVEIELLPLRATSLFSKVTSLAGEGYQIYLGGGGWRPPPLQILRPTPSAHLKQRWPPVTQRARSRRSYAKIRDCEQSNYISKILGGSELWQSQSRCPLGSHRKKRVTRMELKWYIKHEKWGVFYPTEKWVRGTWIWDETFFQFFFYY